MGDQTINPNGAALKRTQNLADLNDAPTARANIGHSVAPRAVVGPPGSADVTHTSIQAAHDDLEASGGGLIHVRAGTYTEDLIWTDSTLHLRGEASHGGVAVVGEATFDIGIDGDASTSHQIEVSNIIFTPAADQVAPVVSVSGDPARVWFRNCRFWATDEACDALSVDVADGLVGLEGCHVWNDTGATGTPLAVNGGTVKLGPGCAIDHGDLGYAIDVVGGAVWCPAVDLDITGRVRNLSMGNGSFAIFLKGCAITAPDASAFTCDGAGAVILGQLAVTSAGAGGNPVAEGNGAFVWAPDVTSMTQAANPRAAGHTAPAATLNAGLGPIAVRTAGYLGISAAGIPYTPAVDGDWEDPNPANVGSALDALAAGAGGGGGGGSQTMALRQDGGWFVTANTTNHVPFDTIECDTLGGWSTVDNTLTVPSDGVYRFDVTKVWATSGATNRGVWRLQRSDGEGGWDDVAGAEGDNAYARAHGGFLMRRFTAGDVVRLAWTDQSGTAKSPDPTTDDGEWWHFMCVERVGD